MNNLPKVVWPRSKRLGRGVGSGKGFHTVGRGQKGQKARRTVHVLFEGLKVKKSLLHRLPQLKGKAKNKPLQGKPAILRLSVLNAFSNGDSVSLEALIKKNLVVESVAYKNGVKILGSDGLTKKLEVLLPMSKKATEEIKRLGGTIV